MRRLPNRSTATRAKKRFWFFLIACGGILFLGQTMGPNAPPMFVGLAVASVCLLTLASAEWEQKRWQRAVESLLEATRAIAAGSSRDLRFSFPAPDDIERLADTIGELVQTQARSLKEARGNAAWLESLVGALPSGVIAVDRRGETLLVNEAASRLLDMPIETPVGRNYLAALPEPSLRMMLVSALQGASPEPQELIVSRGRFVVRARAVPVKVPQERVSALEDKADPLGAVIVLHDITGIRNAERARRDLVANVSHELRTPVASIKGFAETLLEGSLQDPQYARRHVERISEAAHRLERMIYDLLRLARLESAQLPLQPEAVDLKAVAERLLKNIDTVASDGPAVRVEISSPPPPRAWADLEACEQVLWNLVHNALRHTPSDGRVTLRLLAEGPDRVRVEVEDTGIGIPPDKVDRVFERFYRVDPARDPRDGGVGLGLAIVKHLVQAQGGNVGVESEVGHGSLFWFTLPTERSGDRTSVRVGDNRA